MKRIAHALLCLALLPALVSAGQPGKAESKKLKDESRNPFHLSAFSSQLSQCHYEQTVAGTHTLASGITIAVPIGRIVVTACSSPEDLARQVAERAEQVRAQATAQAVGR